MRRTSTALTMILMTSALVACTQSPSFNRPLGDEVDEGGFGDVTRNNSAIMLGEFDAMRMLNTRFAREVPNTITFPFNSAELTPEARKALDHQADWIGQFPELRFSVYGHADAVGSSGYNKTLGKRRAQAVVNYFASKGISPHRLEALVSYGESRPVIATQNPEEANRRTVTEVAGFRKGKPTPLNGKYAQVVFREYILGAARPHPSNRTVSTQVNPE